MSLLPTISKIATAQSHETMQGLDESDIVTVDSEDEAVVMDSDKEQQRPNSSLDDSMDITVSRDTSVDSRKTTSDRRSSGVRRTARSQSGAGSSYGDRSFSGVRSPLSARSISRPRSTSGARSTSRARSTSMTRSTSRGRSTSRARSTSAERSSPRARSTSRPSSQSRVRSPSPRRESSSSSSSSDSSSSDDSRSSSPEIPAQLPISKLRIKLDSLPTPKSKNYKPVKILTGKPRKTVRSLTTNSLVNKLRSLTCKVEIPRLRFRNLSPESDTEAEVKLHRLDMAALPGCQAAKRIPTAKDVMEPQPPIKIRLGTPSETIPITGRSLSSVLADIVTKPRLKNVVSSREYSDYKLPKEWQEEASRTGQILFTSLLSKTVDFLIKLAETEICRDILEEIVTAIVEGNDICEDILEDTIDELFVRET